MSRLALRREAQERQKEAIETTEPREKQLPTRSQMTVESYHGRGSREVSINQEMVMICSGASNTPAISVVSFIRKW